MNWEMIGATGEWAGAIAVVASLLYLARQIHHSTRQAKSAARYSFLNAYGDVQTALLQTKEVASVFRRGLEGEISDPDEEMQFIIALAQYVNTWSVLFDLHEEGELPDNQWVPISRDIHATLATPGGRKFWADVGKPAMNDSFVTAVEAMLSSGAKTYNFLPGRDA